MVARMPVIPAGSPSGSNTSKSRHAAKSYCRQVRAWVSQRTTPITGQLEWRGRPDRRGGVQCTV